MEYASYGYEVVIFLFLVCKWETAESFKDKLSKYLYDELNLQLNVTKMKVTANKEDLIHFLETRKYRVKFIKLYQREYVFLLSTNPLTLLSNLCFRLLFLFLLLHFIWKWIELLPWPWPTHKQGKRGLNLKCCLLFLFWLLLLLETTIQIRIQTLCATFSCCPVARTATVARR